MSSYPSRSFNFKFLGSVNFVWHVGLKSFDIAGFVKIYIWVTDKGKTKYNNEYFRFLYRNTSFRKHFCEMILYNTALRIRWHNIILFWTFWTRRNCITTNGWACSILTLRLDGWLQHTWWVKSVPGLNVNWKVLGKDYLSFCVMEMTR